MTETALTPARTFGVEIECFLPEGLTRGNMATRLRRAGIAANAMNYTHEVTPGWKLTTDGSLGDYSRGMEVVSPVLSGEAGLAELAKVADLLKAAGCKVEASCGLHVHVGAADLDLSQMRKLAINFVHSETAFDCIMPVSRRGDRSQWVQSNRTAFGGAYENEGINRAIKAFEEARDMSDLIYKVSNVTAAAPRRTLNVNNWRDNARYRKLNFLPYLNFKTVEFRQHHGTIEADKMLNWVKLCVAFVERSKASRPRPRTSTTAHVDSAELGMMLTWLRLTPETNRYYRQRRKEFSQRAVERAQAEAARLATIARAEREIARAEREVETARRIEQEQAARMHREAIAAEEAILDAQRREADARAAAERAEQRRIQETANYAERRRAAEAVLANLRTGTQG